MDANTSSTQTDDLVDAQLSVPEISADDFLSRHLKNSEFLENEVDEDLPETDEEGTTDEAVEEVEDPETDEADEELEEDDEADSESGEQDEAEDDTSTQDADVYTLEELDAFKVKVKINGEELDVDIQDLVKGYSTDQSLSKKGREQSEALTKRSTELDTREQQLLKDASAVNAVLQQGEEALAREYHETEAAIAKAREAGDTYEVNQLKDKREQTQNEYWKKRQQREAFVAEVQKREAQKEEEAFKLQIENFNTKITDLVPDFNNEVAIEVRDFAIKEGIPSALLDVVTSPEAIAFLYRQMKLNKGVSKGAAKRKAAPKKKPVPTKKSKPVSAKKADAEKMKKARAFKENASEADQMDFLRSYASKSLNI